MSTTHEDISDKTAEIQAKNILISAEKDAEKRDVLIKQKKKLEYQMQIDRIKLLIKNLG
jgi:hypothetical protein